MHSLSVQLQVEIRRQNEAQESAICCSNQRHQIGETRNQNHDQARASNQAQAKKILHNTIMQLLFCVSANLTFHSVLIIHYIIVATSGQM